MKTNIYMVLKTYRSLCSMKHHLYLFFYRDQTTTTLAQPSCIKSEKMDPLYGIPISMHMEMKLPHQDQHSKEFRFQKNQKMSLR